MVIRHGNSCCPFALLKISDISYIVTDNNGGYFSQRIRQYFMEDFTN